MEVRFNRHCVYVDNLGLMGCSRDEVARVLGEATSMFEKVGLAVHDLEMSGGEMKASGVELDSRGKGTGGSMERSVTFWREGMQTTRCWGTGRALYVRRDGSETDAERVPLCVYRSLWLSVGYKLSFGHRSSKSCGSSGA